MLRLSVPIQQLLTFWNSLEDKFKSASQGESTPDTSEVEPTCDIEGNASQESVCLTNDKSQMAGDNDEKSASISAEAINIASSIVGTCLAQLCA